MPRIEGPRCSRSRRCATGLAFSIAVLGVLGGGLGGCESALLPEYTDGGSSRYLEGATARAVLDGSFAVRAAPSVPAYMGVRVMAPSHAPAAVSAVTREPAEAVEEQFPPPPAQDEAATASRPASGPTSGPATRPDRPDVVIPSATMPTDEIGLSAATLEMKETPKYLSLQGALASAMAHSLAVKVEAYNPAIRESQVVQQEAVFDAIVFGSSQWTATDEPVNQKPPISALNNGQFWQNQIGVKKLLASGAQVQASASMNYRDIEAPNTALGSLLFSNSYSTNVNLQFTQPLLRGFGPAVNEANIYISRNDHRIALATFKRQVITTAGSVEEAYLNLYLAKQNVEIVKELVDQSKDARRKVYARRNIDADETALAQVDAAVVSHISDLKRFQAAYRNASDALKVLLNDPQFSVNENTLIVPTDEPITQSFHYDLAQLLQTALMQRTEMQEARLKLEQADIAVRVARNNLLPKVDLTAGVQTNGLNADIGSAFSSTVSDGRWIDFSVGVRVEFPLGNRDAEAKLVERRLNREQGLTQIVNIAQQIASEVSTQLRNQYSSYDQLEDNALAVDSYTRQLNALIAKEEINRLTPEFLNLKLQTQVQLALAKQTVARNDVDYNIALMRLEQAKGTLLEYDRISLDHPPVKDEPEDRMRLMGKSYDK